jgi:hypothetical protein
VVAVDSEGEILDTFGVGTPAIACPFTTKSEDEWRGRLRIQRSF